MIRRYNYPCGVEFFYFQTLPNGDVYKNVLIGNKICFQQKKYKQCFCSIFQVERLGKPVYLAALFVGIKSLESHIFTVRIILVL